MSQRPQYLILSATIGGSWYRSSATGDARRLIEVSYYRHLVQTAERGGLDFVLLDDRRAVPDDRSYGRLDAISVLSRLAPETNRIGLAASVPTTYSEPFNVSRELATLDFVSGGRAAWNVTSSDTDAEATNFGHPQAPATHERAEIAQEFVEVSRKLWDSWEDDAVIADRERGWYIDPVKLHHINHAGTHFKIRGPQITYRPPQGHVVVIQEVHDGTDASAAIADVLVLHHASLAEAQRAYAHHQAQAAAEGREVRILQRIQPVLGATSDLAHARAAEFDRAAEDTGEQRKEARRIVGTPAEVADELATWFEAGAVDGFHLEPSFLPDSLEEVTSELVPVLQQRGLIRTAYTGRTLREHLGLGRPVSQYASA